jgi:hypothetical protein
LGFGVGLDAAVSYGGGEACEAVDAVGVDAVASGLGEEAGTEFGAGGGEAEGEQGAMEGGEEFGVRDTEHGVYGSARVDRGWGG